ncbi:hypothetical protein HCH54_003581 [Aspergillus fumigatus]
MKPTLHFSSIGSSFQLFFAFHLLFLILIPRALTLFPIRPIESLPPAADLAGEQRVFCLLTGDVRWSATLISMFSMNLCMLTRHAVATQDLFCSISAAGDYGRHGQRER